MNIQTGRGTIPLITLIAIWSISALTSLPGLAVSPILGDLTKIFPKATDLDIQMLTSLPSLLIIPFILLGGKLTDKVDYVRVLKVGLWLFAASGILYLISNRMWQLIVVSALLGIGSGLIIPLSTGFVSRYFVGTYRVKQFGLSSAITNFTLVIATAVTGYLAAVVFDNQLRQSHRLLYDDVCCPRHFLYIRGGFLCPLIKFVRVFAV